MRRLSLAAVLAVGCSMWLGAQEDASEDGGSTDGRIVTLIAIDGAIGPATADFLTRGIATAAANNAALVVIEMD
ncbi:MAG: nodulation protein NfeD, partial [Gammaproteobacteria bacterium]